jgi:hypothetical protein
MRSMSDQQIEILTQSSSATPNYLNIDLQSCKANKLLLALQIHVKDYLLS